MKSYIKIAFIVSIIFCMPYYSMASNLVMPLHIQKPEKLYSINKQVFGFNSELGVTGGAGGNYLHDSLQKGIKKLPVGALRYPGGTTANFFDWSKETLDPEAIQISGKKHMLNALDLDRKRNNGVLTHVNLDTYLALVEKTNIQPYIVLNLLTSSTKKTIDSILKVKSKYNKKINWELGNELSNEDYSTKLNIPGNWNGKIYAVKSSVIADFINKKYPEDNIGIIASEITTGRHPVKKHNYKVNNKRLQWDKAANDVPGIDAAIIHPYIFFKDKHRAYFNYGDTNNYLSFNNEWRWVFSCIQQVPDMYMYQLNERFPEKKIWITETGLLQDYGGGKALTRNQTLLRMLADTAYFISWMKYYPRLQVQMFHGLFWGYSWATALYPDYSYTANGVAYMIIREALQNSTSVAWLNIDTGPTYAGAGGYSDKSIDALSGLYLKTDLSEKMLFVNSGAENIIINTAYNKSKVVRFGGNPDIIISPGKINVINDIENYIANSDELTIPKYSVVLIEKINEPSISLD